MDRGGETAELEVSELLIFLCGGEVDLLGFWVFAGGYLWSGCGFKCGKAGLLTAGFRRDGNWHSFCGNRIFVKEGERSL